MIGIAMPSEADASVKAQAIEWHIRLRQEDDDTWEAFAQWLAEDERHALAYDRVEQDDLALDDLLPHVTFREAANDGPDDLAPEALKRKWPFALVAGGLAASAAAVIAIVVLPTGGQDLYEVATRGGEIKVVTLDRETEVILNGSTRMRFDRKNPRFASLEGGEAFFRVRHDTDNPFRLTVGREIVEDAGTQFNVVHDRGEVRVAVREGKILYNPSGAAIALHAGQSLLDREDRDTVILGGVSIDAVGSWQHRSLIYSGAPLSQVVADLGRALGLRIEVAPGIAARPFSGTLTFSSKDAEQLKRFAVALDVEIERTPDGWIMKPAGSADR
jgi:transmembrane sensor